jgi:hypothetical protein
MMYPHPTRSSTGALSTRRLRGLSRRDHLVVLVPVGATFEAALGCHVCIIGEYEDGVQSKWGLRIILSRRRENLGKNVPILRACQCHVRLSGSVHVCHDSQVTDSETFPTRDLRENYMGVLKAQPLGCRHVSYIDRTATGYLDDGMG